MQDTLQPLLSAVQRNCHISDARYAGDYTLCIYLLKMREYFRWEKGYAFGENLPQDDVGDWLKQRESFWESIEDESFTDLPLDGDCFDPFDNDALNAVLNPHGLVYSGGLGQQCAPHFFLGKLGHHERHDEFTVFVCEDEYARDLTAPPAMALGNRIYVRRESLRRMLWEKIEEWRWNSLENAMGRALRSFDIEGDIQAALDAMTDTVIDSVVLHEKGEVLAGKRLGPEWERMLARLPRSKTEIMIRAVRDHLADSLTTLPELVSRGNSAALHFYFANLTSMRKQIFPALTEAYESWVQQGERGALEQLAAASEVHWSSLAGQMLETWRCFPEDFDASLQALVDDNIFV